MEKKYMKKDVHRSTIADEFIAVMKLENKKARIISIAPLLVLLLLVILLAVFVKGFFTVANIDSILSQLAIPLIISLGLTFVIIMGSIDLSVEGAIGFAGSAVALMVLNTKTSVDIGVYAIIIVVAAGALIGLLNGIIFVKTKIPSFMVTFAVSSIMTGVAVITYKGVPATITSPLFQHIGRGSFLGIPFITWCALVMFAISFILQEYTAFGRHIYAIGDNESVLRNTGVNIDRVKILVFMFAGLCFGIAGVLGAVRIGRGMVTIGRATLFPSITAVVVGGTALSGGKGGVVNTLIGSLIVVTIQDALILLGVNPYIQGAIQGILIIIVVSLSIARGKKFIVK
jgi:ribose transport system permease protein